GGLPRADERQTVARTRFACPVVGFVGNVMSGGVTDTIARMTWFACPAAMALVTAGPVALRSSQLSNASDVAPASAAASAEFCAWLRAVLSMPTSMASMLGPRNAMYPRPAKTYVM